MSPCHPLEKQLRSWTPRAPSANLKARLFPAEGKSAGLLPAEGASQAALLDLSARPRGLAVVAHTQPSSRPSHRPSSWHWLSPAMAVFLLGLFLYGNQAGLLHQLQPAHTPSLLATAALSRPEFSAYYADVRHSENNALRNTFEWTNENSSLSTARPVAQTNSVIQ